MDEREAASLEARERAMRATTMTAPTAERLEALAWYAVWSATVCLFTVPAAWSVLPGWGWLPAWMLGLPLLFLGLLRAGTWLRARTAGVRRQVDAPAHHWPPSGPVRAAAALRPIHTPRGRDLATVCARGPRPPVRRRISR